MKSAELPLLFGRVVRRIHAVGVGGMGLGPLAIYLSRRGWQVSGEDNAMSPAMKSELDRAGVTVTPSGELPTEADLLVYSTAIRESHPTRLEAHQSQILAVPRGKLLAEVTQEKRLIGVCGSHGKTTTTAMLIAAMKAADWSVSYILGGLFARDDWAPAAVGDGEWLVAELDESDGTISGFSPDITLVVNLDWDHADHYESPEALQQVFGDLVARTKQVALGWDSCAMTAQILAHNSVSTRGATFGQTGDFCVRSQVKNGGRTTLELGGDFAIRTATVQTLGEFNMWNATGALAAAQLAGLPLRSDLLASFPGVRRRQSVLLRESGITVLEDYAHHPAEIRNLLRSLKADLSETERLVVVFQPHRFTRTQQFKTEFAAALTVAHSLHLLEVYGAGETPRSGGTTADLYTELERVAPGLPVNYLPGDSAGVLELLRQSRRPGDCIVFVGAGDIEKAAREWVDRVKREMAKLAMWDALAAEMRSAMLAESVINREEVLASKTTLRVGGAARIYVEPSTVEDLRTVLRLTHERGTSLHVLGRGSNLLVPDAGVDGVVVSLRRDSWASFEPLPNGKLRVGAGLRLKNLCGLAARAGLEGFEFLEGIPGNIGGALRMNAGAMGGWMFDVVESVDAISLAGDRVHFCRGDLHVGYRHCLELREAVAIGAVLRPATVSEAAKIGRQIDVYRSKRQESQPREPSAGCIFKNPENDSAGRLIDACGLKGQRIGDAEVSAVHGNFIINRGRATSAEVIELVRKVRREVERQTGKILEPEVLLYGGQWEDVL